MSFLDSPQMALLERYLDVVSMRQTLIMTNVVDVYINYLRRKVDSGYERALIRTVRGVGYQIGGAQPAARSAAASSSTGVTVV